MVSAWTVFRLPTLCPLCPTTVIEKRRKPNYDCWGDCAVPNGKEHVAIKQTYWMTPYWLVQSLTSDASNVVCTYLQKQRNPDAQASTKTKQFPHVECCRRNVVHRPISIVSIALTRRKNAISLRLWQWSKTWQFLNKLPRNRGSRLVPCDALWMKRHDWKMPVGVFGSCNAIVAMNMVTNTSLTIPIVSQQVLDPFVSIVNSIVPV